MTSGLGSFTMIHDPVEPGQTATEFTGHLGHSVQKGADAAVRIAVLGADTPTGTVTDREGILLW